MRIASYIDHTILKANTTTTEIKQLCKEALHYQFAAVCIPPYFVKHAVAFLVNSKVSVATVVGFPFGYSHYFAKTNEVHQAIADGAQEIDMVMHFAAFKNKDVTVLENEIKEISSLTQQNNIILKVIIESGLLTDEEIIWCCNFYQDFPVNFLKTSTGYASKGASVAAVELMRKHLPQHIKVKASGGIRSFEMARELLNAGANRLGCSASVAIVTGEPSSQNGY